MPYSVEGKLVVAISSRALFDFEEENRVFDAQGEHAYIQKPVDFDDFRRVIEQMGMFWLVVNQPPPRAAFGG